MIVINCWFLEFWVGMRLCDCGYVLFCFCVCFWFWFCLATGYRLGVARINL